MLARRLVTLSIVSALGVVAACSVSEVDNYHAPQGALSQDAGAFTFLDFRYNATEMTSHVGEYMEFRIVDKDDQLAAKAVYKGVTGPDFNIFLKAVIPKVNPPYRFDWWADHDTNHDGKYGGIVGGINEKDHAWRRILQDPLPADVTFAPPRYDLNFVHDTNFVDIALKLDGSKGSFFDAVTLLPFNLTVNGGAKYSGKMLETRVVEKASGHMVGFYRLGTLADTQQLQITNILDEQTTYVVSTFVDVNGDQKFNADEPSFKVEMTSTKDGVAGVLDLGTEAQVVIDNGDGTLPAH